MLFQTICDKRYNSAKSFDKLTIKDSKPIKTTNLMNVHELRPIYNCLDFLGSTEIFSYNTMNPKKITLLMKKEQFLTLANKLSFLMMVQT